MGIKKNITKKLLLRLAMFVAVIGAAILFDVYFDSNLNTIEEIENESHNGSANSSKIFLVSQVNSVNAKTSLQKSTVRKLQVKAHDKFIQKYHQLRNYQVLKAEVKTQTTPLILSYHYLVFKNYFFTLPDEEPLIS